MATKTIFVSEDVIPLLGAPAKKDTSEREEWSSPLGEISGNPGLRPDKYTGARDDPKNVSLLTFASSRRYILGILKRKGASHRKGI
jgi:hypothetical protein